MARLERWRDANEAIRRALRSREATAADPDGVAALRQLGLGRVGAARLRGVPRREADARHRQGPREDDRARRVHGGRVPRGRRARRAGGECDRDGRDGAPLTPTRKRRASRDVPYGRGSPKRVGSRREREQVFAPVSKRALESHPSEPPFSRRHRRRRAWRAAARSANQEGQPPDLGHLAGLGRRRARLRPGRLRGPLRRRRRALGALPQRWTRALHGRHRESGAREVRDGGHPRDRPRGGRRRRRRVSRPLRDERLRPRAPVPQPRRRHVRGDDRRVRDRGAREHALGGLRRRRRRRRPRPLRGRDRRLLHADARPRLRRQRRRARTSSISTTATATSPMPRKPGASRA